MDQSFASLQKLVPEMSSILLKRYKLLSSLKFGGGIGRRALSERIGLTERETRKEADLLKSQGLLHVSASGMELTSDGHSVLDELEDFIQQWVGFDEMEQQIRLKYGISKVMIVPGESDQDESTKSLLGQRAAKVLGECLTDRSYIAVTGGSTIASIGPHLAAFIDKKQLTFLAARGGMNEKADVQANTIVSNFAERIHAKSKTLYLPEQMSDQAYDMMVKEPIIKEMISHYENADVVLHGIGDALDMANRRQASETEVALLTKNKAVGEAFGYYFNAKGEPVHRIKTVGIQLEQVEQSPIVIAVAGGSSKASAIGAYLNKAPSQTIFITDEGAAKKLVNQL
ncbi:sugar-binding transcriptional regulator [Paenisporosarcina cavernae]|uniref:Uncharacterized protein n=1 Tax=Paenisporosarcina cavernae TaxID=2320858 RepID=A0A385YTA9_9BACL|nr:sugar-binding domain-containing protein [Paenisporosarcina cavernae]AYC30105.1 hypothetical protein D3873_09555 [Paenisporosarcina cavernae]